MYTYYKSNLNSVTTGEHMLYATEIAEAFGVYDTANRPYFNAVHQAIQDYLTVNNLEYEQLHYRTRGSYGTKMNKVYPAKLFLPAMFRFLHEVKDNRYVSPTGKKFNLKFINKKEDI